MSAVIGGTIASLLMVMALVSLIWTPYPPEAVGLCPLLSEPSRAHPLGCDALGRDIVSLIMAGARISLFTPVLAVGLGGGLGVILGLLAAIKDREVVDGAINHLFDIVFAFPTLMTAVLLAAALGPGLINVVIAIALINIPIFGRLTRSLSRDVVRQPFVQAAQAMGAGPGRVVCYHVLPNISDVLAMQATSQAALAVLAEASFAYLGLGTRPPTPSWGRLLADSQSYLLLTARPALCAGAAIALLTLALVLLGDSRSRGTRHREGHLRSSLHDLGKIK